MSLEFKSSMPHKTTARPEMHCIAFRSQEELNTFLASCGKPGAVLRNAFIGPMSKVVEMEFADRWVKQGAKP